MAFKNQKFRVANGVISKLLQEELFKQGYKWGLCGQNVSHTHKPYLYTYESGAINFGDTLSHFLEHESEEIRVVTENRLVIAELKPVERPKVVVFGHTYYKDEVVAALAKLGRAIV